MSIGDTLRQARGARGLSVDDVAQTTMIRATVIRAIESESFEVCGGSFYARGHIRSIARAVGVDPMPLVAEYDERLGGAHDAAPAPPGRSARSLAAALSLLVVALLAVAALVVGGLRLT